MPHSGPISISQFSPKGHRLLTWQGKEVHLWVVQKLGLWGRWDLAHDSEVRRASFSPDGGIVLTVSADDVVRLWDAETRQPLNAPMRHPGTVRAAAFSPDGRTIATAY
jgi:WD40 repeat protein